MLDLLIMHNHIQWYILDCRNLGRDQGSRGTVGSLICIPCAMVTAFVGGTCYWDQGICFFKAARLLYARWCEEKTVLMHPKEPGCHGEGPSGVSCSVVELSRIINSHRDIV